MPKLNLLSALLFLSVGCVSDKIEGSWVQPVPGQPDKIQGFNLLPDGQASSINMSTLVYERWKREGQSLILTGISHGNRQSIYFSDTLIIRKLTNDSLILDKDNLKLIYRRTGQR
jgi:hypothetical protein